MDINESREVLTLTVPIRKEISLKEMPIIGSYRNTFLVRAATDLAHD